MRRIALGVEYDGTDFAGWQAQANARSVQAALERAVGSVAAESVVTRAAGRTDAGVHAAGQVVHFDSRAARSTDQWLLGINSNLPADVCVRWACEVGDDFDARRSALWRRYVYLIQHGRTRSALARRHAWWVRGRLDVPAMREAAGALLGEHDFSAFRAAGCQSSTAMRCMQAIEIAAEAEFVVLQFTANAFLYHMVRNLVGTLAEIGLQRQPVGWARELLEGRRRAAAGATAPACGLTLAAVGYAEHREIPAAAPPPWIAARWA